MDTKRYTSHKITSLLPFLSRQKKNMLKAWGIDSDAQSVWLHFTTISRTTKMIEPFFGNEILIIATCSLCTTRASIGKNSQNIFLQSLPLMDYLLYNHYHVRVIGRYPNDSLMIEMNIFFRYFFPISSLWSHHHYHVISAISFSL